MAASLERSKGAVDEVLVRRVLVWDFEAYGVRFAPGCSIVALFLGYGRRGACAVVVCRNTELVSVFGQSIQALRRTEAAICMS